MNAVEKLKREERFFEAGEKAFEMKQDDSYGCHYGMRSTRETAIKEFRAGWENAMAENRKCKARFDR